MNRTTSSAATLVALSLLVVLGDASPVIEKAGKCISFTRSPKLLLRQNKKEKEKKIPKPSFFNFKRAAPSL